MSKAPRAVRVAALTRYGRVAASTRYRFEQYVPLLRQNAITVELLPLLPNDYVTALQNREKYPRWKIAGAYLRRAWSLMRSDGYDVIWLHIEAFPMIPYALERLLLSVRGRPYVLDIDDAFFHRYESTGNRFLRLLFRSKIDRLMRGAAKVFAGNAYIAERAARAQAKGIVILPTVVNLEDYTESRGSSSPRTVVGWLGSFSTTEHLVMLGPVFEELAGDIDFVAMGANAERLQGLPVRCVTWSEDAEKAFLGSLDVGIMPLPDSPFERGKCGFKLIQYMACGLPVVASPVGVNTQIVEPGVNGYLADSLASWAIALRSLRESPSLRRRMGREGRAKVEKEFNAPVKARELAQALQEAAR